MAMEEEEYADLFPGRQKSTTDEEGSSSTRASSGSDKSKCSDDSMRSYSDTDKSIWSVELVSVRSSSDSDKAKWPDESMILDQEDRVSVRSSTESDDLSKRSEEEDYAIKLGTKRKTIEEEEDDDGDSVVYDSSDDEFYHESDEESEEEDDDEEENNQELVEVIGYDDVPLTNEDIMGWIEPDTRSEEEKLKLLPKIRRFLKSLHDNQGFDCSDYPGYISGLTRYVPGQYIIDQRERYPEGYNHLMYMASLALQHYNHKHETKFRIKAVEKVMMSKTKGTIYYLTLNATSDLTSMTFKADVWDDTISMIMEVAFCRPSSPPSNLVEELSPNNSTQEDSNKSMEEVSDKSIAVNEKSNLLTEISRLSGMSDSEILKLIENGKHSPKNDEDKLKLITKVRKYWKSILQSEGFKCTNFPGRISGLTIVIPRQKLIDQMNYLPECYYQLRLMAKLALDSYLKEDEDNELQLNVGYVQTANLWKETDSCYTYFITFTARGLGGDKDPTFEAQVQDKQSSIEVKSCRPARFM